MPVLRFLLLGFSEESCRIQYFIIIFFILLWWHAGHTHTWFACQDSLKHSLTIKWVFTIGVGVKFTPLIRLGFNGLIEIRFSSYGNWRIYKEKRTPSRLNRVTSVRLFSVTEQTVGTRCHKTEQKQKGDARKNRHFGFVRLAVFGDFFAHPYSLRSTCCTNCCSMGKTPSPDSVEDA